MSADVRARRPLLLAVLALLTGAAPVSARTLCTLVADAADGAILREEGDCRTRVTPASTFKVPLAVIGFEAGVLADAHAPVHSFKPGYPDWGGAAWRVPTDPMRWMTYSVVWYSQVIAHQLGRGTLEAETGRLGFGNADFSGDPGQDNGLDRAWIMSSLKVSPVEQIVFLRKLATRTLPVSAHTLDETLKIVTVSPAGDGWSAHGKTGTAFPRKANGSFDEARAYGWYVGWATKAGRTLVFARLNQDDTKEAVSGGLRARAEFLEQWPALAASLGR
ncbi:class D beta-lactamase [Methylobacterium sp. J-090]|uniref:class D beta-lactamase n=1 Tax=Methylobacterium sp. J-090 TaxID=2836666 RepID=UPI001FB92B95|nr:class D beta-lactamase [Methylobacterium sp. J-090]MCJ2082239.1 class D beta-lactamase [Methylobacterium sp. J-090]